MASSGKIKSFTAGQGGSRYHIYASIFRHHRDSTAEQAAFMVRLAREAQSAIADQDQPFVLDLGCGSRAGLPLALATLGIRHVGMDYDVVAARPSVKTLVLLARENGFERAMKTAARQLIFDRAFYRSLEQQLGAGRLRWDALETTTGDAHKLDFDDGTFSFANSAAVFEHLVDVPQATAELARVMKPGAEARVVTHLYPSLSGGHALDYAGDSPPLNTPVEPWDHLRKNRYPAHVYLNRLRAADYMKAFREHFIVLEEQYRTEGENLLTPSIRSELADWSYEDLTRRVLTVRLRKR